MSDFDTLDERLRAVERALADADHLSEHGDVERQNTDKRERRDHTARINDLETRLDELDAAVQAIRGYVGNVRAVNADVERRADAALAKAETCQAESSAPSRRESSDCREPNELPAELQADHESQAKRTERSATKTTGALGRLRELL